MTRRMTAPDDRLLTSKEAQAILGCGRTFLTERAADLGGRKVGSRLKFLRADLDAYLDRVRIAAPVADPAPQTKKRSPLRLIGKAESDDFWGATTTPGVAGTGGRR